MSVLPLGERTPIEVTFRELDGKQFTVSRLNAKVMRVFREQQADPENYELAWKCAGACLPGITDAELECLEIDSITKIIWLASEGLDEVEAALKAAGAATPPPSSSTMT